jgi:hypothetical protein
MKYVVPFADTLSLKGIGLQPTNLKQINPIYSTPNRFRTDLVRDRVPRAIWSLAPGA